MANLCHNKVMIYGDDVFSLKEEILKKIDSFDWNCKGLTSEVKEEDGGICFELISGWAPPMNLLDNLSREYRDLRFCVKVWSFESYFRGYIEWINGEKVVEEREDWNWQNELTDENSQFYKLEEGEEI